MVLWGQQELNGLGWSRSLKQNYWRFINTYGMKEAKRLFSKSHKTNSQNVSSSIFKSKISRKLPDESRRSSLGPGQYNIALPMVKPKFEAIRKNSNTLIIKVNEKLSPAFQSIQPRFKQKKQEKSEQEPRSEVYAFVSKNSSNRALQKQNIMSIGMKNRLKKLAEIIDLDETKHKQRQYMSQNTQNGSQFQTIEGDSQILNNLKLYKKERERLHFILKNIKYKNQTRGASWSKYRQTKGNLYSINNVPGPGAYENHQKFISTNRYIDQSEDKSWQFKSMTKRSSFGRLGEQKSYEIAPSRNHFVSDINGRFYKVDSIPLINYQAPQIESPQEYI